MLQQKVKYNDLAMINLINCHNSLQKKFVQYGFLSWDFKLISQLAKNGQLNTRALRTLKEIFKKNVVGKNLEKAYLEFVDMVDKEMYKLNAMPLNINIAGTVSRNELIIELENIVQRLREFDFIQVSNIDKWLSGKLKIKIKAKQ